MYDLYGNTVVISKEIYDSISLQKREELIKKLIVKGYKKIFVRSKYTTDHRTLELQWVSPYKQPPYATKFIHKEGEYYIYGDLKEAYYNPRYHYERQEIKKILDSTTYSKLILIGSGTSPYTLYLSKKFEIKEIEPNILAHRYGCINLILNKKSNSNWSSTYEGEWSEVILSMIPTIGKEYHKKYNFEKFCIFYVLLEDTQKNLFFEDIISHYNCFLEFKKVRDYSKFIKIYRVMLHH